MRLDALRTPSACQGCGASGHEGLCGDCGDAVLRVHRDEHETPCRCADCGTWTRASERMGAAMTLATAKRVAS